MAKKTAYKRKKNISRILKTLLTIAATIAVLLIAAFLLINLAGILDITVLSSRLTYDLLQGIFPILLTMLFIVTALLFRPVSARKVPPSEPLYITEADSFLYNIPPDESYMPLITYTPDLNKHFAQEEDAGDEEAIEEIPIDDDALPTQENNDIIFGDEELSFFQDLENFDAEQSAGIKINQAVDPIMSRPIDSSNQNKTSSKPTFFSFIKTNGSQGDKNETESETLPVIEDNFENRLEHEVQYANDQDYDITLAMVRLRFRDKNTQNQHLPFYEQAIREYIGEASYIYQYKEPIINCYAMIIPFVSFPEAQKELIALYRYLNEHIEKDELIFSCGFSSRFNRDIEHDVLLHETDSTLRKALRKRSFCMIGFEPDIDDFDTNI